MSKNKVSDPLELCPLKEPYILLASKPSLQLLVLVLFYSVLFCFLDELLCRLAWSNPKSFLLP